MKIELLVAEENLLSAGVHVAAVRSSVEEMLAHLKEQIARTEKVIRQHFDKHPGLKQQRELLDSIPGIAETTAAVLLAEVPNLKQYRSARQVAAFAGLVRSFISLTVCSSQVHGRVDAIVGRRCSPKGDESRRMQTKKT